jgi:predicted regulator of Ras-like GTPase activity (Roadblock/LC7/MglB family)
MTNLERVLQEFQAEVGPEFLGCDIIGTDGLSIAQALGPGGKSDTGSEARMTVIMKLSQKVNEKLNMGEIIDAMVTTDMMVFIGKFIGDGTYLWTMAVAKDATLGNIRIQMEEYAPKIWDAIPR